MLLLSGKFVGIGLPTALCAKCNVAYGTDVASLIKRNLWPGNPSLKAGMYTRNIRKKVVPAMNVHHCCDYVQKIPKHRKTCHLLLQDFRWMLGYFLPLIWSKSPARLRIDTLNFLVDQLR